jgi:predicted ATP-dependent Lon-type protease
MEIAVEMRKRVTDQLAVILPMEFSHVEYGFQLRTPIAGALERPENNCLAQ